jgi:hypothetical protein
MDITNIGSVSYRSTISLLSLRSGNSRVTFKGVEDRCDSCDSSIDEAEFVAQEEGRRKQDRMDSSQRSGSSFNGSLHLRVSRQNLDVDEDILHRAAADAGLGSMGTVYVEVWCLTKNGTLERPEGGYWMDPVFHSAPNECGCCGTHNCSACRISDPDHVKFIPADPVAPGVGLAGVLWSESVSVEDTAVVGGIMKEVVNKRKVVWRDVQAMSQNPHLPYDERLMAIADAGLGWAAGVPFHVNNHKGIVIYVARKTVDHALLREPANEQYLLCAADLIGSAWSLREPRRLAMASRKAKREAAIRRARLKILTLIRMGVKFDHPIPDREIEKEPPKGLAQMKQSPTYQLVKEKLSTTASAISTFVTKCNGSNNKPPPPFSNDNAIFTFVGCFISLTVLAGIAHALLTNHGEDFLLLMPPFGGKPNCDCCQSWIGYYFYYCIPCLLTHPLVIPVQ